MMNKCHSKTGRKVSWTGRLLFWGLASLMAVVPLTSFAGPQKGPFESREALIRTLFNSGFDQIIEFYARGKNANVLSEQVDAQQNLKTKATPFQSLVKDPQKAIRIKSMDYEDRGIGKLEVMGTIFGDVLYEAYKVSNIAICHKITDRHNHVHSGEFDRCLIFPRPIDEVMDVLERHGVIEQ